jgi:predicted ATP-grasp superfamily ATP-dependent carboligase
MAADLLSSSFAASAILASCASGGNSRRGLALSPAIYQEYIPGDRHVRVCAFSNDIHAYELVTPDLDWRPASYSVCYTELTPALTTLIRKMLYRLHLRMGIFDFKIDARSGETVWLEVNPQGQFFFLEGLTGSDLRGPLCKFLVRETLESARQRQTISERPKRQSRMAGGRV